MVATRINYDTSCWRFEFFFFVSWQYGVLCVDNCLLFNTIYVFVLTVKLLYFFLHQCVKKNMFEQKIKIIYAKIQAC